MDKTIQFITISFRHREWFESKRFHNEWSLDLVAMGGIFLVASKESSFVVVSLSKAGSSMETGEGKITKELIRFHTNFMWLSFRSVVPMLMFDFTIFTHWPVFSFCRLDVDADDDGVDEGFSWVEAREGTE
ncbi:hypothetical protein [Absidia glauca]|uniref:Uncharacterized protein n=1 Tax=Absidia glauca TaxID=4829 RepID=A0A163MU46_ABSGL|nr:hypothetical protein [Absidia glauca]